MTLWPLSQEVSVSIGGQARLSLRQEICKGRNRIFCSRSKLSKRFYCCNADLLVLVSKGSVYLMTGAAASDIKGVKQVDYTGMMRDGKAVLIGTNARSADLCGFRCQSGLPDNRVTLTFKAVEGKGPQINDMLALGGPKQ